MGTKYKGDRTAVRALDVYIKLMRGTESVTRRIHDHLAQADLTVSQFGVLEALFHLGTLSQRELGEKLLKSAGNITMVLGNLEERGLVTSEWSDELPGPAKRTYEITDEGRRALERWSHWLREARTRIDALIERLDEGR